MFYNVFLAAFIGAPRDHHAIYVETSADGAGYIFQVTGDIQNGMKYECKPGKKPENSASFSGKTYLGWIDVTHWNQIGDICSRVPPPKKQFKGPKKLFPKEPLRRCQDWTREAIQALTDAGVLQIPANTAPNNAESVAGLVEDLNNTHIDPGQGEPSWSDWKWSSEHKCEARYRENSAVEGGWEYDYRPADKGKEKQDEPRVTSWSNWKWSSEHKCEARYRENSAVEGGWEYDYRNSVESKTRTSKQESKSGKGKRR